MKDSETNITYSATITWTKCLTSTKIVTIEAESKLDAEIELNIIYKSLKGFKVLHIEERL